MENDEVTSMLMTRFDAVSSRTGLKSRIVVWMDHVNEFRDIIDSLELGDIRLLKWNGYNGFQIKYTVEFEDVDSRFLIYMPGNLPSEEDNILADIIHYSRPTFSADKSSCLAIEIGISESNLGIVKRYTKFFNNIERRKKFRNMIANRIDDKASIIETMVAISLGSKTSEILDILSTIIVRFSVSPGADAEDEIMSMLDKYGLADEFWNICKNEFGYEGESIRDLIRSLFITTAIFSTNLSTSTTFTKYILSKECQISNIIERLMRDSSLSNEIDVILEWVTERNNLYSHFMTCPTSDIVDITVFPCVDRIIIDRSVEQMCSTFSPLDDSTFNVIKKRHNTCRNTSMKLEYGMLISASVLMELCMDFENYNLNDITPTDLVKEYTKSWCAIDTDYRHFIQLSDQVESDNNSQLIKLVDDTYTNTFLGPLNKALCSKVSRYIDLPVPSQTDFCSRYVKNDRNMVVIISDAFRYECAKELKDRLGKTSRVRDFNLEYMISTVPSITSFGMAALLPNNGLEISRDGNYDVLINGERTESGNREIILKGTYPDSIVLKYSQIIEHGKVTRELCRGKRLIYVYHDAIDAIGDDFKTESKVFEACDTAIKEIEKIIRIVTNWNYTKFVVTADHGFLYRRGRVEDYDKISTVDGFQFNRRYALNNRSFGLDRTVEFSLDYLSGDNSDLFVSIPDSLGLFKLQGGGLNYVHGGISPQEIVVPVLTVNTVKGAISEQYVGLKSSGKLSVKQINPTFRLLQEYAVSSTYREAEYELWLENADHQRLTTSQIINAKSSNPSELEHNVKFKTELNMDVVKLIIKNKTNPDEDPKEIEYIVNRLYDNFI